MENTRKEILPQSPINVSPTKNGDGKPSTENILWPACGMYNEFEAHDTKPQQDHKGDGSGITIHKHIDLRQQPWETLIRANVHDITIRALPPAGATKLQVREWLYLVLTCKDISGIADKQPYLVSITIRRWKKTGQALRDMEKCDWDVLCPRKWRNVYGKKWYTEKSERKAVGAHLHDVIAPLIAAERKEMETINSMVDEKVDVFDDDSTLLGNDKKVRSHFFFVNYFLTSTKIY
jgi:hypothetical protein